MVNPAAGADFVFESALSRSSAMFFLSVLGLLRRVCATGKYFECLLRLLPTLAIVVVVVLAGDNGGVSGFNAAAKLNGCSE